MIGDGSSRAECKVVRGPVHYPAAFIWDVPLPLPYIQLAKIVYFDIYPLCRLLLCVRPGGNFQPRPDRPGSMPSLRRGEPQG